MDREKKWIEKKKVEIEYAKKSEDREGEIKDLNKEEWWMEMEREKHEEWEEIQRRKDILEKMNEERI